MSGHFKDGPPVKPSDDDDDPVTAMLRKTGCLNQHYELQVKVHVLRQLAF